MVAKKTGKKPEKNTKKTEKKSDEKTTKTIVETENTETKKKEPDRYIYTPDAVFRGDILDTHDEDDMSERRKKRLEAGRRKKARSMAAKKRVRRGIIYIVGLVCVFFILFAVVGTRLVKLNTLRTELKEKQAELERLQSEVQKNEDILKQVNSDEYIEQKARSEFNMIKDGEILYKIETDQNHPGTASDAAASDTTPGTSGSGAGTNGTSGSGAGTNGTPGSGAGTNGTSGSGAGTNGTPGSGAGTYGTSGSGTGTNDAGTSGGTN